MSIVKINAITVPADSGDELATRFAARAGAVDGQDGFEGFELLRPTDDRAVVDVRDSTKSAIEKGISFLLDEQRRDAQRSVTKRLFGPERRVRR